MSARPAQPLTIKYDENGGNVYLSDCVFENNTADNGGGLLVLFNRDGSLNDMAPSVSEESAENRVYMLFHQLWKVEEEERQLGSLTIQDTKFTNNVGPDGGRSCIYAVQKETSALLIGCRVIASSKDSAHELSLFRKSSGG